MTFQLDTSGVVVAHGYRRVGSTPVTSYEWSDLSPFCQGYIEAMFAEAGFVRVNRGGEELPFGFSDLAPATLARIIADCERFLPKLMLPADQEAGAYFWGWRQDRWEDAIDEARPDLITAFPPLRLFLDDQGLVCVEDVA